jgi:hypothetical protein
MKAKRGSVVEKGSGLASLDNEVTPSHFHFGFFSSTPSVHVTYSYEAINFPYISLDLQQTFRFSPSSRQKNSTGKKSTSSKKTLIVDRKATFVVRGPIGPGWRSLKTISKRRRQDVVTGCKEIPR